MGRRLNAFRSGAIEGFKDVLKAGPYLAVFGLGILGGSALTATLMTYFPAEKDKAGLEQRAEFSRDMCKDASEGYRNIISSQYESMKAADSIEENLRELRESLEGMSSGYEGTPGLPGKTGIDKVFDGPADPGFGNLFEGPGQPGDKKKEEEKE